MNELICEMCGSNNIVKQDGLYVCQACNTKYSVEEARKMMTGEKVEVEGTVKIDTSSELSNLYEVARRAKNTNNSENALRYYDQILVKDPNSWEAQFYVIYFRAMNAKIIEIGTVGTTLSDSITSILELVKNTVDINKEKEIIQEIYDQTSYISNLLYSGANNWYTETDYNVRSDFTNDYLNYVYPTAFIMFNLGDGLINLFGEKYRDLAVLSWKQGIDLFNLYMGKLPNKHIQKNTIEEYSNKIQKYEPDFKAPKVKTGGCYVATSIYGSYDCPEVWTLRRFRDTKLKKSIFGRIFINFYYATSPTIVKYFGNMQIFNSLFKPILDKFVNKLQEKGVESTIYFDY